MPCETKENCKNGAECEETNTGKYCDCKPGTEGAVCEIVPACSNMDCGTDAKCGYSVSLNKAVCQCNEETLTFYPEITKCKSR